jgi:hypothetical protein
LSTTGKCALQHVPQTDAGFDDISLASGCFSNHPCCKLVAFRGQIDTVGFWRLARLPQIADDLFERAIQRGNTMAHCNKQHRGDSHSAGTHVCRSSSCEDLAQRCSFRKSVQVRSPWRVLQSHCQQLSGAPSCFLSCCRNSPLDKIREDSQAMNSCACSCL